MFRKALVPIDGSEVADAALACVVQAAGPETKVVLVQVVDSAQRVVLQSTPAGFGLAAGFNPNVVDSIIDAQRNSAEAHLDDARSRLLEAGLIDVERLIVDGLPGEEIVRLATEQGFDLVVMGTHGRSGLARGVMGSVADHVVRNLEGIPVLLIKPPES